MAVSGDTFGRAITRLNKQAQRHFSPILEAWGLAPGLQAYILGLNPHGPTPQKDLAESIQVDPANVSRALRTLQELGYLNRLPHGGSLRDYEVVLTPLGRELQGILQEQGQKLMESFQKNLEPHEWDTLVELASKASGLGEDH